MKRAVLCRRRLAAIVLLGGGMLGASVTALPQAEPAFLGEARSLIANAQVAKAEAALIEGLKVNPENFEGHFLLGYVLFRENKPEPSLAEYTKGAAGRPPNAAEFRIVGADYVLLADFADADRWFTRATKEAPENAYGWYLLGRAKYNEGKYAEAVQCFQQALALKPGYVKAEENLGLSFQALNRNEEAKTAYENAIAWAKEQIRESGEPFLNLGELLLEQGQPEEAAETLARAVDLSPKNPKAHEALGHAWQAAGNLPMARAELEKAAELAPKSSAVHFQLGQVYRRLGEKELARKELDLSGRLTATHSSTETPNVESMPETGETPLPSATMGPLH